MVSYQNKVQLFSDLLNLMRTWLNLVNIAYSKRICVCYIGKRMLESL
jgi:hypothetical protein